MEREILFTGIGGQGIQLAARSLAEAAIASGHRVQLFASYGGMMRGGNSDSFLVIGDSAAISAPPVTGRGWAAVVMHHEHAAAVWPKLGPDSIAAINTSVVDPGCRPAADVTVLETEALDIASQIGAPMAASLVLVGALVASTDLVDHDALLDSASRVLPSYRSEAAAINRRALEAGLALTSISHPAWTVAAR